MDHDEINKLIATKVLGLPEIPWDENTPCPYCGNVGRFCGGRSWCECGWYYSPYKYYTYEIKYAWEVVEKIKDKLSFIGPSIDQKWNVVLFYDNKSHGIVEDDVSLAICKAALYTVGINANK